MSQPEKYMKMPVIIEAMLYQGPENHLEVSEWVIDNGGECQLGPEGQKLIISTLEGQMDCWPGCYVIRGVEGEFYPIRPDILWKTYKKVEDDG